MLLDTDILIDVVRRHPPAFTWFATLIESPRTSGYSAIELVTGCRDSTELHRAQTFLTGFTILWPDEAHLNYALDHFAPLTIAHGIGALDILIGATCLTHNLPLATFNIRHFRPIPNLVLIQPYTR